MPLQRRSFYGVRSQGSLCSSQPQGHQMPPNAGQQVRGDRSEPEQVASVEPAQQQRPGHCPVRTVQGGEPRPFAWVVSLALHFASLALRAIISAPCGSYGVRTPRRPDRRQWLQTHHLKKPGKTSSTHFASACPCHPRGKQALLAN